MVVIEITRKMEIEASICSCNEPWLHATDTQHKAIFKLSQAWSEFWLVFVSELSRPLRWLLQFLSR